MTPHEQLVIAGLKTLVAGQNRQNELLETLISRLTQTSQLDAWKKSHPELSQDCTRATEVLGKVQNEFLRELTDELMRDGENLEEWALREFIDKYGQRLLQLNGMIAHLAQLGVS